MDIKIMKNAKNTLLGGSLKWILGASAVLMGVQSAMACTGTAYIRVPSTWSDVNIFYGNETTVIPKTAYDATSDYYIVDLGTLKGNMNSYFLVYSTDEGSSIDHPGVLSINSAIYNQVYAGRPEAGLKNAAGQPDTTLGHIGIKCPGDGASVYVMDNPTKPGTTYTGDVPSGAKYFHFLVPDNVEWQGDQIIMNIDGVKDTAMSPDPNLCGWVSMVFESAPSAVYFYRKNDPAAQIGQGGIPDYDAGKPATPIDLATQYETFGVDELYFMPDEEDWPDGAISGWNIVDPGVPDPDDKARCSFSLAALIYDSDESVNPVFSHDGGPDLYGAAKGYASGCVGVHHGIVDVNLGPDGKPKFSGSANAVKCFGNEANFNTLFNYTPGKNEVQCYDLPFRHYGTDTRWGYDSDSAVTNDLVGGFSPLEETSDLGVVTTNGVTMGPLAAARTKRAAAGPVPTMPGIFPMKVGVNTVQDFDHYCNTPGWTGGIDCEGKFDSGDNPADFWCWGNYCNANFKRWGDGSADLPLTTNEKRNQQFCFQSHATFVYHEDQEFTFRGDDDIWVFINKKLAVDNGGAHLAAPGHVVLKNLNAVYGEGFLEKDNTYDLDIFFCDRRTTMSNVIIKTNMYIQQKVAITSKKTKDYTAANPSYELCYKETGDGSCAAAVTGSSDGVECCGADFTDPKKPECAAVQIHYYLVNGSKLEKGADGSFAAELLPNAVGVKGGFDLSNPAMPVIHKDKLTLGPGKWTLWSEISGKTKLVYTYRSAGVVDVVYGNAVALDSSDQSLPCTKTTCGFMGVEKSNYKVETFAMGGVLLPVYVTAVQESGDSIQLLPYDARGLDYTLDYDSRILDVYAKGGSGPCMDVEGIGKVCKLAAGEKRVFGEDGGVDTLYATVDMNVLENPTETYSINVTGHADKKLKLTYYLPQISFVDSKDPDAWKEKKGEDVNDPKFVEYWVGSFYDFNVVAMKPDEKGVYYRCEECSLPLSLTIGTSDGITLSDEEAVFENGFATISLRCIGDACKTYRHAAAGDDPSIEKPAAVVITGGNPAITATYYPIYFREPPVPVPQYADIFDVKGAPSSEQLRIYLPYQADEYLDGIADSIAIYYNRPIHKDSLPNSICILWDSTSAQTVNAYKEGLSNIPKDSANPIMCNAIVDQTKYSCLELDAGTGYCANRIEIGGLELSSSVKTAGEGMVYSFAQFEDKGKTMKQGFDGHVVDRIAPVVLEAIVLSRKDADGELTGYDNLTITVSEPVKLIDQANVTALDFYLNSATSLDSADRLASATAATQYVVSAMGAPVISVDNGKGKIEVIYYNDPKKPASNVVTPHAGDYMRLGGDMQQPVWIDAAAINAYVTEEVQRVSADAAYNWNAPTGYKETTRLPSRWILVTGDAEVGIFDVNFAYTGNAANCETCVEPITVFPVSSLDGNEQVIKSLGGLPGQFVKSDMKALYDKMKLSGAEIDINELYFSYEVEYYTNLGAYVAGKSGKIYCSDAKNMAENGAYYFGGEGHDCTEHGTNFFLAWNMKSDKGREVGTGAYITKMSSYVRILGNKENQKEETSIFGIRKSNAAYPIDRTWEDFKKHN